MTPRTGKVLISGAGIAGLTLATLLKGRGFDPLVIERDPGLRREGYMMDFFGSGWDVAERMGLTDALRAIRYPIEALEFVDDEGHVYASVPISRISRALDGRYVYLRRSDLERILYERSQAAGVRVRFGTTIAGIAQDDDTVHVTFNDGSQADFDLVFGADGLHSRVRSLVFGPEKRFARFLGGYVAAFHVQGLNRFVGRALKLHEETNRLGALYPLDADHADATYVFRHDEIELPADERLAFVKEQFKGSHWILEDVLREYRGSEPIYFDSLTQIVMPEWSKGRVALLGDACGCLTLLAGQGSHMAMADAFVLARELERHGGDHDAAFAAYQAMMKPPVDERQRDAAQFARYFIPDPRSRPWLRRLVIALLFSPLLLPLVFRWFGARSVLKHYA